MGMYMHMKRSDIPSENLDHLPCGKMYKYQSNNVCIESLSHLRAMTLPATVAVYADVNR